jgi:hypothetical protein
MDANLTEMREVTADEMQAVEGGAVIPYLGPVIAATIQVVASVVSVFR